MFLFCCPCQTKENGPPGEVANTNHFDSKSMKIIYVHCFRQSFQAHCELKKKILVFYFVKLREFMCISHIHKDWLEYCKSSTCIQILRNQIQKCCYETTATFHSGNFWEKGNPPSTSTKAATGYEEMKHQPRIQILTKPFLYTLTASFTKGQRCMGPS